jgi:hypothetical protein
MNLRLTASLVFVGAIAYACSPQSRTTVTNDGNVVTPQGVALASIGGAPEPSIKTVEKTLKSGSQTLKANFAVAPDGQDIRFTLKVVNTTPRSVEVNFASGQAYDFVVVDSVGREVWRWSADRIFTQSVRNRLLGKGEAITAEEKWAPARPGKFTAIAQLTSSNYPVQEKIAFEKK